MKKSQPLYQQTSPTQGQHITEAPTKIARILAHLLTGASINRFEAERLGDHCLPSTIAVLANTHCLVFKRQSEKVPNRWGKPCVVMRYSLPEGQHKRARAVLVFLKRTTRPASEE